jgi:molybdopterin/thiamine biosynthesis adenylyltransferase
MSDDPAGRLAIDLGEGRFHRHGLIPWWDQDRLARATALVLGAGALGNEIIKNLCLLGVGHIRIVDLDVVENSNLSRSPLFRERHEGRPKALAAAESARELYPAMKVAWQQIDLVHELGWGHVLDADLVLTGLDGREARLSANRACIRTGKVLFDGAIEGIAGVARAFDGREGPCYECTMGERDWQLVRHRRSCNMLSREQMSAGHTPTVTTISSIIAALQVQQAVKHLHGLEIQRGVGLAVNGIGFDAWQVTYPRNAECYAHEPAERIVRMPWKAASTTVAAVIDAAGDALGKPASLELRHDLMSVRECPGCGECDRPLKPLARLGRGAALCPRCGRETRWESIHRIDRGDPLADRTLADLGIPPYDVVRCRAGLETFDAVLDADRTANWDA